jgi:hypothetical protein
VFNETRDPIVGEMKCAFRLSSHLESIGASVRHALAHETSHGESESRILLGNSRTNHLVRRAFVEQRPTFVLRPRSVEIKHDGKGQTRELYDDLQPGGHVYAIVSRFFDSRNQPVTILGCNHAWVFDQLARLLTDESELAKLFHKNQVQLSDWARMPSKFELLLQIFLENETEAVGDYRVIEAHGFRE